MRHVRGLLLDFYGTVVEEDDSVIRRITEAIVADVGGEPSLNAAIGYEWWRSFSRLCEGAHGETFRQQRVLELESLKQVLSLVDSTLDAEKLSSEIFSYWRQPASFEDGARLMSGASLRPTCIVSNIDRNDIEMALSSHDFSVDHVVTSEDARAYKPRPEMFALALDALELGADEVVHVGDSVSSDVLGAAAVGIRLVWINRSGRALPDDVHPWRTIQTLDELDDMPA